MLTIHFGVRHLEVDGFAILYERIVLETDLKHPETLLSNKKDDWDNWGNHTIGSEVPRHLSLRTVEPAKTLSFIANTFEPYLVHSNNVDMINARLVLTDSDDYEVEYEEFRW